MNKTNNKIDLGQLHDEYAALPVAYRMALERAYEAARESLNKSSINTWGDDRAEELLAALTHYFKRCGNPLFAASAKTEPLRMAE